MNEHTTAGKVALITGVTGQDGSYLVEFLLKKGYQVYGVVRRNSTLFKTRIDHLQEYNRARADSFKLVYGDLTDASNLSYLLHQIQPDEIYNLGAQSHVRISFDVPIYTVDTNAIGTLRLLEAIRSLKKEVRFYQASSSEMFGKVAEIPQTENTPFHPRSPYGCSKVFGYQITRNYRESYGLFGCNGILFNHESPRRGENFVTRKITKALARMKNGSDEILFLGNLDAKRDWGYAGDYVEAMWLMLQQDKPDDYVIATGETHSVRHFLEEACKVAGIKVASRGSGINEEYINLETGKVIVKIDPIYFRPAEVDYLQGDASKARQKLGWRPRVTFKELVKMMVEQDLNSPENKIL
jgi:GDPmannose 4,6-dehydratase